MSDTSKLRWALYENVYQPALVFPAEELGDTELPAGHTVVYLLGMDANVVVPDANVSDYDPRDTAKMSHPAAASGVAMAQQILEGFQGEQTQQTHLDDDESPERSRDQHHHHHNAATVEDDDEGDEGVHRGTAKGASAAADLRLLADDDNNDEGSVAGAEDEEAEDDDEARRRRRAEKKLRKEEKRKAKEAKKAAKAAVKREREEITSAPTLSSKHRHRKGSDADEDDDGSGSEADDAALLAAMSIEKKYGARTQSSGKVKKEKRGDDDDDAASDDDEETSRHKKKKEKKNKKATAEGSWAALEEDLFPEENSDEDEDEGDAEGGDAAQRRRRQELQQQRGLRSGHGRMGQALAALNATNAMQDIPGLAGACPYAQPYLMEIHYQFEQLAQEASNEGLLLSMQKGEVIRAIDQELRQKAAQRAFLESTLRARQQQLQQQHASSSSSVSTSLGHEVDALYDAMAKLEAPSNVADLVRQLVKKQMPPRSGAFDRAAAERAHKAVQRRTRTFQDTSVVTLIEHLRSVDAAPREDGPEAMRRYIQQRRQHEDLKSNLRGLTKTGFYAVPKPLEKWRRGRDMMVLRNAGAEAQKVLPTSYISQANSAMVRRMKEHAEKRYDRVAVTARDGASFLDPNSFTLSGLQLGLGSQGSGAAAPSPALTQQQQRLAASSGLAQHREAFFQFHQLRCDTETPVTVETVALNADFGGVGGLSQNVLASVDDLTASMAPASVNLTGMADNAHGEDSVHTNDDGLSQASYSVHSAAPSSYPYLFDSEPQPSRRSHRAHRQHDGAGNSLSGVSSRSEGASAISSRASSMGSAYGEQDDTNHHDNNNEGGRNAKETGSAGAAARRHRRESKTTANGASNGAGSNDWRTNAKRSIMEQLTLYCRGRGGKPAILSSEQCREIGRTLLDRAMRAEAERQGVSLAVQANNLAATFTKTTEQRLKKSVDHYLERRMGSSAGSTGGLGVLANGGVLGAGHGNNASRGVDGVLPMSGEPGVLAYDSAAAAAAAAAARQRAVADTPVYEN